MVLTTDWENVYSYSGIGQYEITFPYFLPANVKVTTINSSGVESAPLSSGYTIITQGSSAYVDLTAEQSGAVSLRIYRDIPLTQPWSSKTGADYDGGATMNALDRIVYIIQQVSGAIASVIKAPNTENVDMTLPVVVDRANKVLGFDASGLPSVTALTGGTSLYMKDGLVSANEAAFKSYFGIVSETVLGDRESFALPTSPAVNDRHIVIAKGSGCYITQSLAEHGISYLNSLFTTKGVNGKIRMGPKDRLELMYVGNGDSKIDPMVKQSNPATLPGGNGLGAVWSPDGRYLAIPHSGGSSITIYDWESGSPVKIADPAVLPAGDANGAAWSPDGRYLAVGHTNTPFITIYDWNTGSPVKIPDPAALPAGNGNGLGWSPDGRYLGVAHLTTPFITIYDWDTGSPVKISDPLTLPAGTGYGVDWSPEGRWMAVSHATTPFVSIYHWESGSPVKIGNPLTLPGGTGLGVSWSPNGRYMAVASTSTPFVTVYDWVDGSPEAMDSPSTLPTGSANGIGWSPDGRYMAVLHINTPNATIYDFKSGAFVKTTNPVALPAGNGFGIGWSPDLRYVAVAHSLTPFVSLYKTVEDITAAWIVSQHKSLDTFKQRWVFE